MKETKKPKMRTYDQIAIDKLREIEPTTSTKWAQSLGFNSNKAFWWTLKQLMKTGLIVVDTTKKPYKYSVVKEIE